MELQSELRMEFTRRARPIEVLPGPTGRRCWPDALEFVGSWYFPRNSHFIEM